ncbi:hypothetical protein FOA52_015895 [Chlamydomonas sp. UWO 241]|nr:hypothetical protein FOA52_015895 [Chlamydomonas sp. UWO 241]
MQSAQCSRVKARLQECSSVCGTTGRTFLLPRQPMAGRPRPVVLALVPHTAPDVLRRTYAGSSGSTDSTGRGSSAIRSNHAAGASTVSTTAEDDMGSGSDCPGADAAGTSSAARAFAASLGHLHDLPRQAITAMLEDARATRAHPPQQWLEELYSTWTVHDPLDPSTLHGTFQLLQLLGALDLGTPPPLEFLETIYFAVGIECARFDAAAVLAFLNAAAPMARHHSVDRDLLLSLTSHLVSNRGALLASAGPGTVAALLPAVTANGQAPGVALTSAVLSALLPTLEAALAAAASAAAAAADGDSGREVALEAPLAAAASAAAANGDSGREAALAAAASAAAAAADGDSGRESGGSDGSDVCSTSYSLSPSRDAGGASGEEGNERGTSDGATERGVGGSPSERRAGGSGGGDTSALTPQLLIDLLYAAAGPGRPPRQLPAPLEPAAAASALASCLHAALPSLSPGDAVACLAGLGACRLPAPPGCLAHGDSPLPSHQLSGLLPAQLCALCVALSRLQLAPGPVWTEALHTSLTQAEALGAFGDSDQVADALRALDAVDRQLGFRALDALALRTAARATAGEAPPAELVNALFVLATVGHNPGYAPIGAIHAALAPHLSALSAQALTNVLWGAARMGGRAPPADYLAAATEAAGNALADGRLAPYQIAFIFGSLVTLGAELSPEWVDALLERARVSMPALGGHDVALILNTVQKLGHVTTYAWMSDVEAHVSLRLEAYTPQELTTVAHALVRLHHRPASEWLCAFDAACCERMGEFSPDNVVMLLWALVELGHAPSEEFLAEWCASARVKLPDIAPRDLVSSLACLARLGHNPGGQWLGAYLTVLQYHMDSRLDGHGLASVAKSLADMQVQISADVWWSPFCDAMARHLPSMPAPDLLDACIALARCGVRPPPGWASAAAGRADALHAAGALTPDDTEALIVSLGSLGVRPPQALMAALVERCAQPGALAALGHDRLTGIVVGVAQCAAASAAPPGSQGGDPTAPSDDGGRRGDPKASADAPAAAVAGPADPSAEPPGGIVVPPAPTPAPAGPWGGADSAAAGTADGGGAGDASAPPMRDHAPPEREFVAGLAGAVRSGLYGFSLLQLAALSKGFCALNEALEPEPVTEVTDLLAVLKEWLM